MYGVCCSLRSKEEKYSTLVTKHNKSLAAQNPSKPEHKIQPFGRWSGVGWGSAKQNKKNPKLDGNFLD
jgi:hypothetical protein